MQKPKIGRIGGQPAWSRVT